MRRWLIAGGVTALAVVGALFAIVLAGGSSDEAAGEASDEMAAFRECMEEQGVDIPEPPQTPDGSVPPAGATPQQPPAGGGGVIIGPNGQTNVDPEAMEACSDLLPAPSGGAEPGFRLAPQD